MRQSDKKRHGATVGGWIGGMVLGALAMYIADPEMGRRRRAAAQERLRRLASRTGEAGKSVV